jgi:hypothetical protein
MAASPERGDKAESFRPTSVAEALVDGAAGFLGLPGLTPRHGVDGSPDEGSGFQQDGTARKAGGVAGSSGPSDRGQRAGTYTQSGLNGYGSGMNGFGTRYGGLYDELHYDLWGRNDPARGGRIGGRNGYSREIGDLNFQDMLIDKGLNYGAGDALLPFYDGTYTTVYTRRSAYREGVFVYTVRPLPRGGDGPDATPRPALRGLVFAPPSFVRTASPRREGGVARINPSAGELPPAARNTRFPRGHSTLLTHSHPSPTAAGFAATRARDRNSSGPHPSMKRHSA